LFNEAHFSHLPIDFRDPRTFDVGTYDHSHLNSVCALDDGTIIVSLGRVLNTRLALYLKLKDWTYEHGLWSQIVVISTLVGRLVGKKPKGYQHLIVQPAKGYSAVIRIGGNGLHELELVRRGVAVPSHSLTALDGNTFIYLHTSEGRVIHYDPVWKKTLSDVKVTDDFLRGCTRLGDDHLLLGSKGEIIKYNWKRGVVEETFQVSKDNNEFIFALAVLPEHFTIPPAWLGIN
jgi:hypothetical protein